jgi:hypothetical protein
MEVDGVLRATSLCAVGEQYCLGNLGASPKERCHALAQHESLWGEFSHSLKDAKTTSLRFPTIESLRSSPDGNPNITLNRWREGARETLGNYEGERAVITGLSSLGPAEMHPWVEAANRGEHKVLFLQTA